MLLKRLERYTKTNIFHLYWSVTVPLRCSRLIQWSLIDGTTRLHKSWNTLSQATRPIVTNSVTLLNCRPSQYTFLIITSGRFSIGFKSENREGHTILRVKKYCNQSIVYLAECIGALSCWNSIKRDIKQDSILNCYSRFLLSDQHRIAISDFPYHEKALQIMTNPPSLVEYI